MEIKRVVLIHVEGLGLGGVAVALLNLIARLESFGFTCRIASSYDEVGKYEHMMIPSKYIAGGIWCRGIKNRYLRALVRLFNIITRWRYAFVFARKIPHDIFIAYQVIGAEHMVRYTDRPSFAWIHGEMFQKGGWLGRLERLDQKSNLNKFKRLVAVSADMSNLWYDYYGLRERPLTIMNFINVDALKIAGMEHQNEIVSGERPQIIYVGSWFVQKGVLRLLNAAQRLFVDGRKFDLWFVGMGRMERTMRNFVADNRLNGVVHFIEAKRNPHPYIRACDLLVLPSFREGFGLVLWEALLQHTPVMATKCGGCVHALKQGEWGLLVENSDEGVYNGLSNFLNDPTSVSPRCGFDDVELSIRRANDEGARQLRQILGR